MKYLLLFLFSTSIFAETFNVEIVNMKFNPSLIKAKTGDKVIFTNKMSMLHNIVSPESKIRSPFLKKDEKFTINITKKDKIMYFCEPHKAMGMKGIIEVKKW